MRNTVIFLAITAAQMVSGWWFSKDEAPKENLFMWDLKEGEREEVNLGTRKVDVVGVSSKPNVLHVKGVFTNEELKRLKKGTVQKSLLRDKTGKEIDSTWRVSQSTTYRAQVLPVSVLNKVSLLSKLPLSSVNRSTVQVVEYGVDKRSFYYPHYDTSQLVSLDKPVVDADSDYPSSGRYLTVLIYLSTVEKGGETIFPFKEMEQLSPLLPQAIWNSPSVSERFWKAHCAKKDRAGLSVKPARGNVVMFYNHLRAADSTVMGDLDLYSYHGGCPPITSSKIVANFWIPVPPSQFEKPIPANYWDDNVPREVRFTLLKSFGDYLGSFKPMHETILKHGDEAGLSEEAAEALQQKFQTDSIKDQEL